MADGCGDGAEVAGGDAADDAGVVEDVADGADEVCDEPCDDVCDEFDEWMRNATLASAIVSTMSSEKRIT